MSIGDGTVGVGAGAGSLVAPAAEPFVSSLVDVLPEAAGCFSLVLPTLRFGLSVFTSVLAPAPALASALVSTLVSALVSALTSALVLPWILVLASTSVVLLTLARLLQGLGGGGLMTLSQALVGEAFPPRERARYQGYLAAVAVCANTFGPVAGGRTFMTAGLILAVMITPIIMVVSYSLLDGVITNKNPAFVGFANYMEVLTDPVFVTAVRNTLVFTISSVNIS